MLRSIVAIRLHMVNTQGLANCHRAVEAFKYAPIGVNDGRSGTGADTGRPTTWYAAEMRFGVRAIGGRGNWRIVC